jgi:hypothetical protein
VHLRVVLPPPAIRAIIFGVAALLVVLAAVRWIRAWKDSRIAPEERERRRRASLTGSGKVADAILVEVRDDLLFYTYDVRGLEYTASQDISTLRDRVPGNLSTLGVIAVKYDRENPANSIILAEAWSGLRC